MPDTQSGLDTTDIAPLIGNLQLQNLVLAKRVKELEAKLKELEGETPSKNGKGTSSDIAQAMSARD